VTAGSSNGIKNMNEADNDALEQPELRLSVVWQDADMMEIQAEVHGLVFCGRGSGYVRRNWLKVLADQVEQFDSGACAEVMMESSNRLTEDRVAVFRLRFTRVDLAGHVLCEIVISDELYSEPGTGQRVFAKMRTESTYMVSFVRQVRREAAKITGKPMILQGLPMGS
jgi:hypothetical protein